MKRFLDNNGLPLAALLLWVVVLAPGCNDNKPALDNTQTNVITQRESLVEAFGTTEVMAIPDDSSRFVVRDTNGVVWFVSTASNFQGRTRLFGWHEEFPRPVPPPAVCATNTVTYYVTNSVTNIVLEDTVSSTGPTSSYGLRMVPNSK